MNKQHLSFFLVFAFSKIFPNEMVVDFINLNFVAFDGLRDVDKKNATKLKVVSRHKFKFYEYLNSGIFCILQKQMKTAVVLIVKYLSLLSRQCNLSPN